MGGALVTTIMFGGSMAKAYATEHETTTETATDSTTKETDTPDEKAATEDSSLTNENEADDTNTGEEQTGTEPILEEPVDDDALAGDVPMDEPGLIPGDFFYFVEAIAEKIQLALTFNDTAKAELISQFANERIAEANALFEKGDTDGAIDLLNKALESQELALNYVTEEEKSDDMAPEGDAAPEETEGERNIGEDAVAVPDNDSTEDNTVNDIRDELQTQFSQNITALLLALEKVENPKAKAALAKNVEKAYAKMERKLGKMKEIEERITAAIPIDEEIEDLRTDIRSDQEDFESDMAEVEEKEKMSVVPPIASKKAPEKTQEGQQRDKEKLSQTKQIKEEKQVGKRDETPTQKSETKTIPATEKAKDNTNTNVNAKAKPEGKAGSKAKVNTEENDDVEAGEEVTPNTKENLDKGIKGQARGKIMNYKDSRKKS